jgi:nitrous oxidase accessory protein NosD
MNYKQPKFLFRAVLCGLFTAVLSHSAMAATLCVNPAGSSGCYAKIADAVSAAGANDRIAIGAGTYSEGVVVNKPLALLGAGSDATIINAKGQPNGIYIDGLDHPGMTGVLITGLTVMNANFEGILVTNSSYLVISGNHVTGNNQSLDVAAGTCPGAPVFETNEGQDCGEGIHLMAVDHAMVAQNESDLNSGGILLTDETGYNHDNVIAGNSVHDNPFACGITMASHPPSPKAASKLPYGIFNNTITRNVSEHNGLGIPGAGAGVGIFAPGPGNRSFGNKVIGNILRNNGSPGVSMHNHAAPAGAPGIDLDDTVIAGNTISGNGADTADAATPGTTGISIYSLAPVNGTLIVGNTIEDETEDIAINTQGSIEVHLNDLLAGANGVLNLGKGSVDATLNYWGCAGGAGTTGCASVAGPAVTSFAPLSEPAASGPRAPR